MSRYLAAFFAEDAKPRSSKLPVPNKSEKAETTGVPDEQAAYTPAEEGFRLFRDIRDDTSGKTRFPEMPVATAAMPPASPEAAADEAAEAMHAAAPSQREWREKEDREERERKRRERAARIAYRAAERAEANQWCSTPDQWRWGIQTLARKFLIQNDAEAWLARPTRVRPDRSIDYWPFTDMPDAATIDAIYAELWDEIIREGRYRGH